MSEQLSDRAGLPNLIDRMKQLIPAKFRRDAAIVRVLVAQQLEHDRAFEPNVAPVS